MLQYSSVNSKLRDYENKLALISQETERLNMIIISLRKENDELVIRYSNLE